VFPELYCCLQLTQFLRFNGCGGAYLLLVLGTCSFSWECLL
jgi:hypothetical protein